MPTISAFYGITIRIFCEKNIKHNLMHFHAYYNEYSCVVDINSCELINGDMPIKQRKLILAWAEIHKDRLLKNWKIVQSNGTPFKIKPLS